MSRKKAVPNKSENVNKVCSVCGRELPIAHFSTLPRWQSDGIESRHCTTCSWLFLVTHQAIHETDGETHRIMLRPREKLENIDLMHHVWENLPSWVRDSKIIAKYAPLGDINSQTQPFYEFHQKLKGRQINKAAFLFGGVYEPYL